MTKIAALFLLGFYLSGCTSDFEPDISKVDSGFEVLAVNPSDSGGYEISYRFVNRYDQALCFTVERGIPLKDSSYVSLRHEDASVVLYEYEFDPDRMGSLRSASDFRYETIAVNPGEGFDNTRNIEDETAINDAAAGEPIFFTLYFGIPSARALSVEFCKTFLRDPPNFRPPNNTIPEIHGPLIFPSRRVD